LQRGVQALARRNHSGGQVGRKLTGAGLGREVAFVLVIADLLINEGIEATARLVFASGPERTQVFAGCLEPFDCRRHRVAFHARLGLGLWRRHHAGQGAVQAAVADLAELAEHLEVGAGLGQHTTRLEKQLVQVAVEGHAVSFQGLGHGAVAAALVNAIFLVDVYRLHRQLAAQLAQYRRRLVPGRGVAD